MNIFRSQAQERKYIVYICDDHCWFGDVPGPDCNEETCSGRTAQHADEISDEHPALIAMRIYQLLQIIKNFKR